MIAVAFLDRIKVQFQLDNLLLVNSAQGSALRTDLPREMFRFQRRDTFRVRPLGAGTPRVTLVHPHAPDRKLQLRIFDVSMGGLAFVLPHETAPAADFPVGTVLGHVQLQLDRSTQLEVQLRVQHITEYQLPSKGVQLGCAFESLPAIETGILQRYIDHTQKRQRSKVKEPSTNGEWMKICSPAALPDCKSSDLSKTNVRSELFHSFKFSRTT